MIQWAAEHSGYVRGRLLAQGVEDPSALDLADALDLVYYYVVDGFTTAEVEAFGTNLAAEALVVEAYEPPPPPSGKWNRETWGMTEEAQTNLETATARSRTA